MKKKLALLWLIHEELEEMTVKELLGVLLLIRDKRKK